MFLLSKLLPKSLKKRYEEEGKMPCLGEKPKDYQFRVLLLDDTDMSVNVKVSKGLWIKQKLYK